MARERPSVEELEIMAQEEGMTFAKMGRILQVDRKTAKRWCLDAGIERVGKNILKPQKQEKDEALPMVKEPLPEAEVLNRDRGPNITSIARKVSKGEFEELTSEEKVAFDALVDIIKAAMARTIEIIHDRIDNHFHTVLSTTQGRQYIKEQRERKVAGAESRGGVSV